MAKKKKTNPNKVPVAKGSFDQEAYIQELLREENIHACLLVMSALGELEDMTAQAMVDTWFRSNHYDPKSNNGKIIKKRAEDVFDFHLPYPNAGAIEVKTEGDLKKIKYQYRRYCLYSALCVFCVAAYNAEVLSERATRSTYLNAQITEEEIAQGRRTYEEIRKELRDQYAIDVGQDEDGIWVRKISET